MYDNIIDFNNARRQDEARKGDISAEAIRDRLNASTESFVQWLFSGRALCRGSKARVGDVYGTPGASLSISLVGPEVGMWHDHATGEGGDLISLYRACMGYAGTADFGLSLKEIARDYFGDSVEIERPAWRPTPVERIEAARAKLGTRPREDMLELGAPVATYKYFDTRGNVLASVVRYEPDGTRASKTISTPYCFKTVEGVTRWVPGAPDLRPAVPAARSVAGRRGGAGGRRRQGRRRCIRSASWQRRRCRAPRRRSRKLTGRRWPARRW